MIEVTYFKTTVFTIGFLAGFIAGAITSYRYYKRKK